MPSGPISHLSEPLPSMPKSPAPESQHGGPRGYFRTFHNILDEKGSFVYIALTPYTYAQTHHGHYTFCKYVHTTHTTNSTHTHTQYTQHTQYTHPTLHHSDYRPQTPYINPYPCLTGKLLITAGKTRADVLFYMQEKILGESSESFFL